MYISTDHLSRHSGVKCIVLVLLSTLNKLHKADYWRHISYYKLPTASVYTQANMSSQQRATLCLVVRFELVLDGSKADFDYYAGFCNFSASPAMVYTHRRNNGSCALNPGARDTEKEHKTDIQHVPPEPLPRKSTSFSLTYSINQSSASMEWPGV